MPFCIVVLLSFTSPNILADSDSIILYLITIYYMVVHRNLSEVQKLIFRAEF
jgi:hypothetical protein